MNRPARRWETSRRIGRTAWFLLEIALFARGERRDPATRAWILDNLEVVTGRTAADHAR